MYRGNPITFAKLTAIAGILEGSGACPSLPETAPPPNLVIILPAYNL